MVVVDADWGFRGLELPTPGALLVMIPLMPPSFMAMLSVVDGLAAADPLTPLPLSAIAPLAFAAADEDDERGRF